jgi:chromosome segregation ATPase
MSDTTNIEKKSLEAHVEICAERYTGLNQRFDHIEDRLNRFELTLTEIRDTISQLQHGTDQQWARAKDVIIGLLVTCLGVLIVKFIL